MTQRSREEVARAAFGAQDAHLSLMAHQSTELAELAGGRSSGLHGDARPLRKVRVYMLPLAATMFILLTLSSLLRGVFSAQTLWYVLIFVPSLFALCGELIAYTYQAAEDDFVEFEKSRENWEVENFPEGEVEEMYWIYKSHGFSDLDAKTVADTLSKYRDFWVDHMLVHEVGVFPRKHTSCLTGVLYSITLALAISTVFSLLFFFSDIAGSVAANLILASLVLLFPKFNKSENFWLKRVAVMTAFGLWQLLLRSLAPYIVLN